MHYGNPTSFYQWSQSFRCSLKFHRKMPTFDDLEDTLRSLNACIYNLSECLKDYKKKDLMIDILP